MPGILYLSGGTISKGPCPLPWLFREKPDPVRKRNRMYE